MGFLFLASRLSVDLLALLLGALIQFELARLIWSSRTLRARFRLYSACKIAVACSFVWVVASLLIGEAGFQRTVPHAPWVVWIRAFGIAWGITSMGIVAGLLLLRSLPQHDPDRRRLLKLARAAVIAAPAVATGYGVFVERKDLRLRAYRVELPNLPKDLDGLRIVQLSDIHLSPFLSERDVARAVDLANETRAHLAIVTGDLITSAGDPVDVCLRQLARLRSDAGTFGCLGNHEIYAGTQDYTAEQGARLGMRFLRSAARRLRFGASTLNLAGVDYQRSSRPYLAGTERLLAPDAFNLLLSHNPDVFPVAAAQGWNLTIGGHTHGGQVTVEILNRNLNLVQFITPYVYGIYRKGQSAVFVTRGIGTVGVPVRIGAPPEVALIRLCAI